MAEITASGAGIRLDDETGVVRSYFDLDFVPATATGPADDSLVADEFLAANSDLFRLDGIGLVLAEKREGSAQVTCKYDQYYKSIPVYGAFIQVTLSKTSHQVVSSVNRIEYDIQPLLAEAPARITARQAIRLMHRRFDTEYRHIVHSRPRLYFYRQHPAWRIEMDTRHPVSRWELFISAVDGTFLEMTDRRRFLASRKAKIFVPDPVTSSGNGSLHWGSPTELLDAERVSVMLENLDATAGPALSLSGKWVRMAEKEDPVVMVPAATGDFDYSCRERGFLGVMAYYYLDRLVEWLRSLEIPVFNAAFSGPIEVDAQGLEEEDNSHFVAPVSGPVYLAFGEGGTPDASDPGVIVHEFGHALHYFLLGKLTVPGSNEEGFNDFLSCVFRDRFNTHGFDRANPFPWDNNRTISWDASRRCDSEGHFDDPGFGSYGFYKRGTVWASALWEIYLLTGGGSGRADERLKAAGEIIGTYMDMLIAVGDTGPVADLAKGLVSSDLCRTGGVKSQVILGVFQQRGLRLF